MKSSIKPKKTKELEETIEPDPKDQRIKELQKEVNALVNLVKGMQERERRYQDWLNHMMQSTNQPKPDGHEQRLTELEELWRESNNEFTRLVRLTTSFQIKAK